MLGNKVRDDISGKLTSIWKLSLIIPLIFIYGCKKVPPCEDKIGAFVISKTFIEQKLKSPRSAIFPSITEAGVEIANIGMKNGRCEILVKMPVDAQNSFGALVRETFYVTVSPDEISKGSWDLIDIHSTSF